MKDTRLKLGIDVDGILSDFVLRYREICLTLSARAVPQAVTDWGMSNWGLTQEEHKQAWAIVTATPNFYLGLPPYEEINRRAMIEFSRKHRLYFITTRMATAGAPIEIQTGAWLSLYCGIEYPTVLVEEQKGQVAAALKLDAMIDDRPENLLAVQQLSPNTTLFLRDRGWNHNAHQVLDGYTRVHSFQEFEDALEAAAVVAA